MNLEDIQNSVILQHLYTNAPGLETQPCTVHGNRGRVYISCLRYLIDFSAAPVELERIIDTSLRREKLKTTILKH